MLFQVLTYVGYYLLLFFYTLYIVEVINSSAASAVQNRKKTDAAESSQKKALRENAARIVVWSVVILCWLSAVLWISSIFNGMVIDMRGAEFTRGRYYLLGQMGGLLIVLIDIFLLVVHWKLIGLKSAVVLATLPLLPLAAALIELRTSGQVVRVQFIFLSMVIIYTYYHQDTERELERTENALLKSRIEMMTGRMQPHYLYNVLSTIYYLCDDDAGKAQKAVGFFSEYLRNVLETLQRQEPVTLSWERSELRNYLSLEKMRFGDRLRVEYESSVEESQVMLPPL